MKLSTIAKKNNNQVFVNTPGAFDLTIGSWLFDWSEKIPCDIEGGVGIDPKLRIFGLDDVFPDYDIVKGLDYSVGYTWEHCPRKCPFCKVPLQNNPKEHKSIWTFHDNRFGKIDLLNNNTFSDPQWKETFHEIWDAKLKVKDEGGYDLRLVDEEKAEYLKKTKFESHIHYAWDLMENEEKILHGLKLIPKNGRIYVLVGFNTTHEQDLYRCQKITDAGHEPYIMVYDRNPSTNRREQSLKRMVECRAYKNYKTYEEAWKDWKFKEEGW